MKTIIFLLSCLTLIACSGTPPTNIGLQEGKLTPCPDSPNCVGSFEPKDDEVHFIEPIRFSDVKTISAQLEKAIKSYGNATIIKSDPQYIYAEYQSDLMKYVDDVEFYIVPSEKIIHVRSASRLGYDDIGANRSRIETVRLAIQ